MKRSGFYLSGKASYKGAGFILGKTDIKECVSY